jgi:hypothetical protein
VAPLSATIVKEDHREKMKCPTSKPFPFRHIEEHCHVSDDHELPLNRFARKMINYYLGEGEV